LSRSMGFGLATKNLGLRIVGAVIASLTYYLIFSYIPSHPNTVARALGVMFDLQQFISFNQSAPVIGLVIAASKGLAILFRKTRAEGFMNIAGGLLIIAYIYLILNGGVINVKIPTSLTQGIQVKASVDVTTLMYLFLAPPILTTIKGLLQITKQQ